MRTRKDPPSPGSPAPDFTLRTPYDVDVDLQRTLLRGSVLIEFIRGTWDPNSRLRLAELDRSKARLDDLSARVLVVSCERADTAREYLEKHPSTLSLLVDTDRSVTRAWGVFQRFSFGAFRVARTSSFLVDSCGFVRLSHVGRSPIDTLSVETITAELESFQRERSPKAPPPRER